MPKARQESRHKGLNLKLFIYITDEVEKERAKHEWLGNAALFDKTLRKVLEQELKESYDAIDNERVYELPDRVGYLADQSGYRRAIKKVLSLLPTN